MQFNTRPFTVAPLPKMHVKVQSVHQHWMANPNITARDLHRLLGMLVFMASLVRRGRLRLRPVQWWAATAWCQRTGNWSDDYVGSRPSARSAQHSGGFPVQSRPDTDHGVDDGHGESTTRVCQVGRTTDRYVCDIRQQTTRQVRIAISGPQGGVDRCHVHALGQGKGPLVRLPAIQDGPASSAEDRSITRSAGDNDRSTATGSIMVPRADGPIPRPDSAVRRRSRPADTRRVHGRGRDRDSSLPAVKSSRAETLRAILRAKGHSREAANMMSRCLRESSQQVYESHWSRFVAFCRTKRWHVFRVKSHNFSTYMMHLFRDGLLASTIISHRMSVASVLRHWVYDPAADPHIKLLVRAFRLECPVQRRIMP